MQTSAEQRAELSLGTSSTPIYRMVREALNHRHPGRGTLLDVGCGRGELWHSLKGLFETYVGADILKYEGFPVDSEFCSVDLDTGRVSLPDRFADVIAAVETIEHLENPRAFARELTRLVKPGGWVVVTTPNQVSLLSKLGLFVKNEFPAFRGTNYPAHLTALLEVDLRRIAAECGWQEIAVEYSGSGRIPGMAWHWPTWLSQFFRRALSDNLLLIGRSPTNTPSKSGAH